MSTDLGNRLRLPAALAIALSLALLWVRPAGERAGAPDAADADRLPSGDSRPARSPPPQTSPPTPVPAAEPVMHARQLDREAMNAWTTGDIRAAMALFEQAIAAAPDDPVPHSHYGRLLTLMVSYERAIPLLERARDLAPQDAQAWLDLATVYERSQRFEDAWAARAEAEKLVGADAVTRDERGRFVVVGTEL